MGSYPLALAAADLDADGRLDLATANAGSWDISVLPGNGDGTFQDQERFAVRWSLQSLVAADLDADGKLDLATPNPLNDVSVLLNSPDCNGNGIGDRCDIRDGLSLDCNLNSVPDECEAPVTCDRQVPGDFNQNGAIEISDPILLLGFLFLSSSLRLPCGDGSVVDPGNVLLTDWNHDGAVDVSDAIGALSWLFAGGPEHFLGTACQPIPGCRQACRARD
ncbi:MAG: VCBS repeat-containing protein [Planctomycetes bacterium]|nr:VCBS repeat-containing protein [Planctomycetota bacterium]